ncbi:MAG: hypothetical protein HKM93_21070 [Desulfobacteraceae bacterium]|nr:hypothetical protein [Desulfobacteraceae bacterium]
MADDQYNTVNREKNIMDINNIPMSTAAMAVAVKQLQQIQQVQTAMMKQLADSQQQMTDIVRAVGIGHHIDTSA